MKRDAYNIAVEISENELRHLIMLHAGRVGETQFMQSQQDYMQRAAERMSALLEVLKKTKAATKEED